VGSEILTPVNIKVDFWDMTPLFNNAFSMESVYEGEADKSVAL
jgi:hypothetical protein